MVDIPTRRPASGLGSKNGDERDEAIIQLLAGGIVATPSIDADSVPPSMSDPAAGRVPDGDGDADRKTADTIDECSTDQEEIQTFDTTKHGGGNWMPLDGVSPRPAHVAYGDDESGEGEESDYVLLNCIGHGGMGLIHRARQKSLGRVIALKQLRPKITGSHFSRVKFAAEAVITGSLEHPNIIPVHDLVATPDGQMFYAMKEVRGTAWTKLIKRKTEEENLEILNQVANAIAFAHKQGVVHRDIKPQNVMVGDFGEVLLVDWGLAIRYSQKGIGGGTSGRAGTPSYMAPEMAKGDSTRIGPTSDIYLLGAVLYEIATGSPPHCGQTMHIRMAAAVNNVIAPTRRNDELVAIARKAMATDPGERFASIQEFQEQLRQHRQHKISLAMTIRADNYLEAARITNVYSQFAAAILCYIEAQESWSGNARARQGEFEARRALAEHSYLKGDYDLTQSMAREACERLASAPPELAGMMDMLARLGQKAACAQEAERNRERRFQKQKRATLYLAGVTAAVLLGAAVILHQHSNNTAAARAETRSALKDKEVAYRGEQAAKEKSLENTKELVRLGMLLSGDGWGFDSVEAARRQAEAARAEGFSVRRVVSLPGGVELALRAVPPGHFVMGSSPLDETGRLADEFLHPVTLTSTIWLAETELTREQWRVVVAAERTIAGRQNTDGDGSLPAQLPAEDPADDWLWRTRPLAQGEGRLPATGLSHREVRKGLLDALNRFAPEGWAFRLPTEAEWEWACRAGTTTRFQTGDDEADARRAGWLGGGDGSPEAQPVGQLQANAWGFLDMHGNAYELVADRYSRGFFQNGPEADPVDVTGHPNYRDNYVVRGGSVEFLPGFARSAARMRVHEDNRYACVGVRLALARIQSVDSK